MDCLTPVEMVEMTEHWERELDRHARLLELQRTHAFCNICRDWKLKPDFFPAIKSCSHTFCNTCLGLYVTGQVLDNSVFIWCPYPGCHVGVLDMQSCSSIIAPAVFQQWESKVCETAIPTKFYCPFMDCSAVLADERGELSAITEAECPHCHRLFCARCQVPWHAGVICDKYQKRMKHAGKGKSWRWVPKILSNAGLKLVGKYKKTMEDKNNDTMVKKMVEANRWQRCPNCKFYVEKIDGCLFIRCRCGHGFCYTCGSTMTGEYHYCNKCKR